MWIKKLLTYFCKFYWPTSKTSLVGGHPLSTCAKFSEKLTFRNVSFLGNFAYVLNGWSLVQCYPVTDLLTFQFF